MSTPIPKSNIKRAKCREDFLQKANKYFVNMTSDSKVLHITNTNCCQDSKFAYEYIDFNNEKEAKNFFSNYNKDINRCNRCFKNIK